MLKYLALAPHSPPTSAPYSHSVVAHQRVVDVCYSRALATENFISNENRAIKKSMTLGDILTKNKVLRKRSPFLRNRYKLELIWEWKSNMSLHNANEIILFDTFHGVWVHMFAIVKLRGKWGEKIA